MFTQLAAIGTLAEGFLGAVDSRWDDAEDRANDYDLKRIESTGAHFGPSSVDFNNAESLIRFSEYLSLTQSNGHSLGSCVDFDRCTNCRVYALRESNLSINLFLLILCLSN